VPPSTKLHKLDAAEQTTVAKLRQSDPPKLVHLLRGDLDWIVMKALEKDRGRRYETANGLAMDIQRHLGNEPVVARPPSAAYRLQKAWRRNKTAFAVATLIVAVLVAATGVSVWQATLARQRLAESEAISKFLTEVFQSPDPARDGRTITVADTLSNAVKKLETDLTNQPARRAKLQATLGHTYYGLGLYGEAIPLQERVRDYYLAASGPEHPDTLLAMQNLATSYHEAGRWPEALKLREEALALCRKVNGSEHPDTLKAMSNLAISYDDAGRREEALKLREQVLALLRKVRRPEDPDTLRAMHNLASSYYGAGRRDEALKLQEQVLALERKVLGAEHPNTLTAMGNLAMDYDAASRRDEALKLREQVLALRRKVSGPEHPDTIKAMGYLAYSYDEAGRRDEALKLKLEVLALRRKVSGPDHPDTLKAMANLADSYDTTGHQDEALKLREQALALFLQKLGPEHPDTLRAMAIVAYSYCAFGRGREAVAIMARAAEADPKDSLAWLRLASFQTWFGVDADYEATRRRVVQQAEGTDLAWTAERAARVYCLRPSTDTALLAKALSLARRGVELGKNDPFLPWYQLALGIAEYRNGQYAAAEGTLAVPEQMAVGDDYLQGTARLFRAMSLFRLDRLEEARRLVSQAEAQMPPLPKDESKPMVVSHDNLIWWLAYKEAKALIEGP
jgi:tetratricopeptide (TPR) repeat protein